MWIDTTQKMKFSIKDFFNKCDKICIFHRIWSHLLQKFLMGNFIFRAVRARTLWKTELMVQIPKEIHNIFPLYRIAIVAFQRVYRIGPLFSLDYSLFSLIIVSDSSWNALYLKFICSALFQMYAIFLITAFFSIQPQCCVINEWI